MIRTIRAATLSDALEALSREIAKREAVGETNYIFCEDRLTLLAERAVLKESGGTFLSEVTTFARYLSTEKPVLSKEGSVMKMGELILERKGEGCFTGASARAVYETIAQLSASRVDAEALESAAQATDGMLKRKLSELAVLLKQYNAFLGESGLIDESGYLALLPEKIADGNLSNVNVFFFAFPSFTRQALEGVRAAFLNAKSVTGIFIGGERAVYTNHALRAFLRVADECELPVEKVQAPTALIEEGAVILNGIYSPVAEKPLKTERIVTFQATDETEELERIAALIKMHVKAGKRYRDIAVLVPGADYFLTVEKVFSSYKIPFYLERKRPLSEHPFARYTLSILNGVADGLLPEEADEIASSVCFGEADEYRNYLLRYCKYRGAARRAIKQQELIKEFHREKLVPFSDKMREVVGLFPTKARGAKYVQSVRRLFELTDWESVLKRLKEDAGDTGDGFSPAEENFLKIDITEKSGLGKTLIEIERIAGKREFTVREFMSLLKSGLDANEVLLIPPSLDAVFVGDATECMFATTPVLFAAGLTENLPVVSQDTAIISDKEIKRLGEIRVEIEPAICDVNARKRESFALNLASFSERLYMSRPVRLRGKETLKSEALDFALNRFQVAPMPEVYPYDCSEITPAALKMIREKQGFQRGEYNEEADTVRYNAIRAALDERGVTVSAERGHTPTPRAAELWMGHEEISPTLLEKYFSCPYEGFMQRALRLSEQREGATSEADAGDFVHNVLAKTAKELNNEFESEDELIKRVRDVAAELLKDPRYLPLCDTKEGQYMQGKLIGLSIKAAIAAWPQVSKSGFRVVDVEKPVSIASLNLAGKADRIDETNDFVRVVDYKTGRFDVSPDAYYVGKRLQLELYLKAAASGKQYAGAFYFAADDAFSPIEKKVTPFAMNGFYNKDADCVEAFYTMPAGHGMQKDDFSDFIEYSYYVSQQAEAEMKTGNYAPSPYRSRCSWCTMKSLCAYTGKARDEGDMTCEDIIQIVREKKGK